MALALWAGLEVAHVPTLVIAAIALCVPCAWAGVRLQGRAAGAALLAAVACAAALRGAAHQAVLERARAALDEDALYRVDARLVEPPLRESGEPLAVVRVESSDPPLARGSRLRVRLPEGSTLEWGDRATLLVRLDTPRPAANPGAFDPLDAADASALVASGRAFAAEPRDTLGLPRATAARWRRAIEQRFAARLGPAARELVAPLVTGDRTAVPPEVSASLRASGLVHLLALSGLHVVWLAAIARGACATLGGGLRARAASGACCALFYVVIAGPLPSLLRAAVTEAIAGAARALELALDPLQCLALTVTLLLIAAPGWGGDVGFQLSCAATLGLVSLSPRLAAGVPGPRALHGPWTTTLGAQLAALPVLVARFHAISWPGLIANLVAVPVSSLLLASAWLGALCDLAVPGAGVFFFSACEPLAAALRGISTLAARAPGALAACGSEPVIPWLAAIGAGLLIAALDRPRTVESAFTPAAPWRVAAGGGGAFALVLALLLAITAPPRLPAPGHWWVVVLDVGQGDAIAVAFPDGWWLVDAGPRTPHHDAGEAAVLPFFRWAGVRELQTLVITHRDGDHCGGVPAVQHGLHVDRTLASPEFPGVVGPAARFGATSVARGARLHASPPVMVRWPPAPGDSSAAPITTDNRASLVLEIGEGEGRVLLTADVDSVIEARLQVSPGIALLKVAHHGSASSSGAAALAALAPRHALLSCGHRNPFGHPAPLALERLARQGAILHRTDRSGAIVFECSSSGVRRIAWRREREWNRTSSATIPRRERQR